MYDQKEQFGYKQHTKNNICCIISKLFTKEQKYLLLMQQNPSGIPKQFLHWLLFIAFNDIYCILFRIQDRIRCIHSQHVTHKRVIQQNGLLYYNFVLNRKIEKQRSIIRGLEVPVHFNRENCIIFLQHEGNAKIFICQIYLETCICTLWSFCMRILDFHKCCWGRGGLTM